MYHFNVHVYLDRPLDVGLTSVEGLRMNMRPAPEHVHLPPIEEQ